MITENEKRYYISNETLILGFILTIPVIALNSYFCFNFFKELTKSSNMKLSYLTLLIFLFFLGLLTILIIETIPRLYRFNRLYFNEIPALILTKDTLIDNLNNQVYRWSDIKDISIVRRRRASIIAISLIDSEKFINKIENSYKRFNAKLNEKYSRGAFQIPPNLIECEKNKLFEELTEYFNKQKN